MVRVLVLDDEAEIGRILQQFGSDFGFETEITDTPAAFKQRLSAFEPELILLDLVFPGGDGIEMLRVLEARRYKGALILISGVDSRVLGAARRLGTEVGLDVVGSMQKPFKAAVVRELFGKIAQRQPSIGKGVLRQALEHDEYVLHYQPVVDIQSRDVLGVEALVRWARHGTTLTQPMDFLPLAAEEGLMPELTRVLIERGVGQAADWKRAGLDVRVAINVPASAILAAGFYDEVAAVCRRHDDVKPRAMFEFTETEAMGDPARIVEVLSRLRSLEIELAIDDFGTGYSSLVELRRLPVTHLKIDQSFVRACIDDSDAAAITRTVIELCRSLGLRSVAEGVETREAWDQLAHWKCDAAQGFYVAYPMPAADVRGWIEKWPVRAR